MFLGGDVPREFVPISCYVRWRFYEYMKGYPFSFRGNSIRKTLLLSMKEYQTWNTRANNISILLIIKNCSLLSCLFKKQRTLWFRTNILRRCRHVLSIQFLSGYVTELWSIALRKQQWKKPSEYFIRIPTFPVSSVENCFINNSLTFHLPLVSVRHASLLSNCPRKE